LTDQVRLLIEENQTIKKENKELKKEINDLQENEKLTKEIHEIEKTPVNIDFSGLEGILTYLQKNEANSISLTASSTKNWNDAVTNLLAYNDDIWWCQNIPNSYFLIELKTKKTKISSYFLRSHNGGGFLQSWKLEGSSAKSQWITIEIQQKNLSLTGKYKEQIFNCQSNDFFSFLNLLKSTKMLLIVIILF
jgi:cell division septum initiation protein DivIVA